MNLFFIESKGLKLICINKVIQLYDKLYQDERRLT